MPKNIAHRLRVSSCVLLLVSVGSLSGVADARGHASTRSLPTRVPVVIVGGGLAGLTVAYKLKAAGIRSLVLEASPRIGGRVHSISFPGGLYAEAGMEEYFEHSPAVPLLRELGLPLAPDLAHSSVRIYGKVFPYRGEGDRDEYLNGVFDSEEKRAFLAWNHDVWALYGMLRASYFSGLPIPRELKKLEHISFANFVARAHLPARVSEWIRVTVEPEIATEWEHISALDGIDELRIFMDTPEGFGETNYHVVGGDSLFTDALAASLGPAGIRTEARVTEIKQSRNRVRVRYLDGNSVPREVTASAVAVTVPIPNLKKIRFIPALSRAKVLAISTTRFGTYVKVHFVVDQAAQQLWMDQGKSLLTLLSDSQAGSIYDATSFQESLPGSGRSTDRVISTLIHGKYAVEMLGLTENEILERALQGIEALFPGFRTHVKQSDAFVYPTAVASWPVELGRSRFDAFAQALRRPEGRVYIGGDMTEGSHSEGAVRSALRISSELIRKNAAKSKEISHSVSTTF